MSELTATFAAFLMMVWENIVIQILPGRAESLNHILTLRGNLWHSKYSTVFSSCVVNLRT